MSYTDLGDILEYSGDDSSSTVGGRGDNASSGGVYLINGNRITRQKVHGGYHRFPLHVVPLSDTHVQVKRKRTYTGGMGSTA